MSNSFDKRHLNSVWTQYVCDKSENARVCAKWQWNALDWCYWIALPASPLVQSSNTVSCVSLSFRTHPCVLAIATPTGSTTVLSHSGWLETEDIYRVSSFATYAFYWLSFCCVIYDIILNCDIISITERDTGHTKDRHSDMRYYVMLLQHFCIDGLQVF